MKYKYSQIILKRSKQFKIQKLNPNRNYPTEEDEKFMKAFESCELPFEQWSHQAHVRMSFNYILRFGREEATLLIRCAFAFVACWTSITYLSFRDQALLQYTLDVE